MRTLREVKRIHLSKIEKPPGREEPQTQTPLRAVLSTREVREASVQARDELTPEEYMKLIQGVACCAHLPHFGMHVAHVIPTGQAPPARAFIELRECYIFNGVTQNPLLWQHKGEFRATDTSLKGIHTPVNSRASDHVSC